MTVINLPSFETIELALDWVEQRYSPAARDARRARAQRTWPEVDAAPTVDARVEEYKRWDEARRANDERKETI